MQRSIAWIALGLAALAEPVLAAPIQCADVPMLSNMNTVTLADYISAGSCQISDKIFSDFRLRIIERGDSLFTSSNQVDVTPLDNDPGLKFASPFWSVSSAGNDPVELLFQIIYKVTVTDGKNKIKDASLTVPDITPMLQELAGSQVTIEETITGPKVLKVKAVPAPGVSKLSDSVNFTPVAMLDVNNVIDVIAGPAMGGNLGKAKLSSFSNRFSQAPEPSSLSILGAGLISIASLIWWRRSQPGAS